MFNSLQKIRPFNAFFASAQIDAKQL